MGAARAIEESNAENPHSQQTDTAAYRESTNLVDYKSIPANEGIKNLDSGYGLANLTG